MPRGNIFLRHNHAMPRGDVSELWKRLESAAEQAGYDKVTQTLIARLAGGLAQTSVRKWQWGDSLPTMENAILLAKKLNISVEWLLTGRGSRKPLSAPDADSEELLFLLSKMDSERRDDLMRFARYCRTISFPVPESTPPKKTP